jgi:hypothetical protein
MTSSELPHVLDWPHPEFVRPVWGRPPVRYQKSWYLDTDKDGRPTRVWFWEYKSRRKYAQDVSE